MGRRRWWERVRCGSKGNVRWSELESWLGRVYELIDCACQGVYFRYTLQKELLSKFWNLYLYKHHSQSNIYIRNMYLPKVPTRLPTYILLRSVCGFAYHPVQRSPFSRLPRPPNCIHINTRISLQTTRKHISSKITQITNIITAFMKIASHLLIIIIMI